MAKERTEASGIKPDAVDAKYHMLRPHKEYFDVLSAATEIVAAQSGVVQLPDIDTLIIPDVHEMFRQFETVFSMKTPTGISVDQLVTASRLNVVFLGDIRHPKDPPIPPKIPVEQIATWLNIEDDIRRRIITYPKNVVWLRGNHDNTLSKTSDEQERYNRSFLELFSKKDLNAYIQYEAAMPYVAYNGFFLAIHAIPDRYNENGKREFKITDVRQKRVSKIMEGLCQTTNDEELTTKQSKTILYLKRKLGLPETTPLIVGHKQTDAYGGMYRTVVDRANPDNLVYQVNDPQLRVVVLVKADEVFEPNKDIIRVGSTLPIL